MRYYLETVILEGLEGREGVVGGSEGVPVEVYCLRERCEACLDGAVGLGRGMCCEDGGLLGVVVVV